MLPASSKSAPPTRSELGPPADCAHARLVGSSQAATPVESEDVAALVSLVSSCSALEASSLLDDDPLVVDVLVGAAELEPSAPDEVLELAAIGGSAFGE